MQKCPKRKSTANSLATISLTAIWYYVILNIYLIHYISSMLKTQIKTNKSAKLRERECVVCKKIFWTHISPAGIASGRGKVCSMECKHKLNGIQKTKGEYRKCKRCGNDFWSRPSEDRRNCVRSYCSRKCQCPTERGKAISTDGYYEISRKKVHRLIMEEHLGRKLLPTEIVHHINFDKLDNRLENLQIVTRSEHNKIHKFLRKYPDNL